MKRIASLLMCMSLLMTACGTAQTENLEETQEDVEVVETVESKNEIEKYSVKQLEDRLELNDGEVDVTSLFEVTKGKETTMLFFTHPRTLDLREAREQKVYVLVRNGDSTIKCFERNVKIGTDEEIASSKVYEKKVETAVNAGSDKKKESNTTPSSNTSTNQPQQSTAQTTQQNTNTQQQTTYTPTNTQPSNTQQQTAQQQSKPQQKCWDEQVLVSGGYWDKILVKNARTENVLVRDAWTEQVVVGSKCTCNKCGHVTSNGMEMDDHILDVHNGGASYGVGEIYETVTHPAEYKQVSYPAEYKDVWVEAVYKTVRKCN